MTASFPLLTGFRPRAALRAALFGLVLGCSLPVFAQDLPEVQRLIKQGQYPQALEKVDAYLAGKPRDAQGRFLKGLILTEMNKPADAIAVFTKLTEDYPELPEPYNNLAVLYAQQKQYDKARTALEMAIRTHPSYAIAYENLGDIYAKLASQAYDKALQIDSANATAQNKMALIRDLISTSAKPNVKPQAPAPVATTSTPPPTKPAPAPTATVVSAAPAAAPAVTPARPTPAPAAAPARADSADDVAKALAGWADAWSRKDVKSYLSYYAPDFNPPKGMSRKAWEGEREDRIAGKSGKISVSYDDPQIAVNGDRATVKFRQHYKATGMKSSTSKTLVFVRNGSKWLIQEENSPLMLYRRLAIAVVALSLSGLACAKPAKPGKAAKAGRVAKATAAPRKAIKVAAIAAPVALVPAIASARGGAAGRPATVSDSGPEPQLARIFAEIESNRLDSALSLTEGLLRQYPNFRLGHLIKGDLLLARAKPLAGFGAVAEAPADKVADLRAEAVARLKGYREKPSANFVPRYLLQMQPDQRYAIVVDTQKSRLYLYENDPASGRPRFVADYYVTQGKLGADKVAEGDKKTPIGVYHVTANLSRQKLADLYGTGAYPISYPNEWDRRQGRSGSGIWLHGTPSDTFSRPPKASDGCVVLTNQDLDAVAKNLQVGLTPVIISNSVEWLSLDDWNKERSELNRTIDAWRSDWESRDTDRYLRHYSRRFQSGTQNFEQFAAQKRQVNAGKEWIKVKADNLSVFRNPGKEEVVVVTFDQDYRSNNLSNVMKKRQYWIREDGKWKIIYEGAA